MKSILLKIDDELFEQLEESVKEANISKTAFIKKAIITYQKRIKEIKLGRQLAEESWMVREYSMKINSEYDSTLSAGLDDD